MTARRGSFRIVFNEGDDMKRYSMADPGHPVVSGANWRVRYSQPFEAPKTQADIDALVLADTVSDLAYLVYDCPSTKLACEKLAALRAAVRKLGPVEGGDDE
jgi:hypothetical protein